MHDIKTVRGADCDSDHYLVKGKLKVKLKKLTSKKGTLVDKYDVNKLKDTNICRNFKQKLHETMNSLNINQEETIDAKWKAVKDAIKTATVTVIGKQNRTRKPWFNNSCKEAFNRRKEANNPYNREKVMAYKECQKEANNIFRYEKRKYTKDVLEEAEIDHKVNRTRQLYQKIKSIRGGYKKHEKFLKNDDGSLVTEQDKVLEKWRQYFGLLLNCENPVNTFAWMPTEPNDTDYFKKAYDYIHRESLINILKEFRFPSKIVSLIGASINQKNIKVKIANTTSQPVRVTTGLRQGDALSPVLFNLVQEKIVREMNVSEGIALGQITIGFLAYADDIALLGDDIETINRLGKKLIKAAEKVGLTVNDDKTEYLTVSRNSRNYRLGQHIELEGHIFKKVSQFKYLGSIITQDNELKTEVSSRIQLANKGYYGLEKVLKSRTLSKNLKIRMYMTLLRPIVMYGSETWALRKAEEQRLGVFERKVLRKIYGPVFDNQTNEWRKLHNYEIQMQFQRPDIIKEITKRRLMWGGHAWRKQGSLVRLVIEEEPIGKRPLGRPRLRWEDCVKKDIKSIGPGIRWREVAEDMDRWQDLFIAAWS
ncbi:hypothetical protein QTP88_001800 [Uroleucon formosanum]